MNIEKLFNLVGSHESCDPLLKMFSTVSIFIIIYFKLKDLIFTSVKGSIIMKEDYKVEETYE